MAFTDPYYDYSHLALISLYGILAVLSIVSFIKSTAKQSVFIIFFHFILLLASLCRAVSFSLFIISEEKVRIIDGNLLFLINELPSFFYLTFFSMALLLSVQVFQESLVVKAVNMDKLKLVVEITNICLYLLLAVLFTLDFILFPNLNSASVDQPTSIIQMTIQFIAAFIYLTTSITFFVFLFKTYYEHYETKFKDASKSQDNSQFKKRSNSIIFFAFLCFFIRSVMTCLTIFFKLAFWYKDLLYYTIFEIVPISALLYIINDLAYKAGNIVFGPSHFYKPLSNENSKLTETSSYLISKYSNTNN